MRPRVSTLEVILANVNGDDRTKLESILQDTRWTVISSEFAQIENVVRDATVPIVLCDRDQSNCWRKTISVLMKARRDVCVILLSGENDAPGADEVARYGGFDIITRPLQRIHVLPMLLFAYTYWRGHGPYLSRVRRIHPSL
jgi:DNA-binding NtrC family response regulator